MKHYTPRGSDKLQNHTQTLKELILLIDDDVSYAELVKSHFLDVGLHIVHKKELLDLNPIARIITYPIILLDYHLHFLSGREIAEFALNISEEETIIIMISADIRVKSMLPEGVKFFFHKSRPITELAYLCLKEVERCKMIKYYQNR